MEYRGMPEILREFLQYHETIRGHSQKTVDEYLLDLRNFFRYIVYIRGLAPEDADFNDISIACVDLDFIRAVTLDEVYDYLHYLSRERPVNSRARNQEYGLKPATRARKVATIRSFFSYLTVKVHKLDDNPLLGIDSPKTRRSLPRYLTLDESSRLLDAVAGLNSERDYCILCLFLNCGLRISEIVEMNLNDLRTDHLIIHGKGGKERVVFLNDTCVEAINDYLVKRRAAAVTGERAFFLSSRKQRIGRGAIHSMIKKTLLRAGLDAESFSAHKLRHTAATLMLQNGVDLRTLQELLGHEHLNTTEIYTHIEDTQLRSAADAHPLAKRAKRSKDA